MIDRLLARIPRGPRGLAWLGIVLGIAAFWIALPPVKVREPIVPLLVGLAAIGLGIAALRGGVRRLGWGAVAVGVLGIALGYLATRSSETHLDQVIVWSALTAAMLRYATPLAFAAMGGIFSERSGVVNIGLEGMMLSGAFFGILGADKLNSWPLGLLCAALAGGGFALIHAFFAIHLRADQIVGGTAINFLALGVTGYFYIQIYGLEGTPGTGLPSIPDVKLAFLDHIPPNSYGAHSFWYQAIG
ncbi:MAG: ral nucleoside transport system permease protein, partial [Gaiellaceae bacterium]|nr:ral nucleoside transport system permease protein [Gaiellaceae bacterium]